MVYFDTSVAIALFVPEPTSEAAEAWFASCTDRLVSLDWLLTEFASAPSIKTRRKEIAKAQATAVWKYFWEFSRSGLQLLPLAGAASMQRRGWRETLPAVCARAIPSIWRWRSRLVQPAWRQLMAIWRKTRRQMEWRSNGFECDQMPSDCSAHIARAPTSIARQDGDDATGILFGISRFRLWRVPVPIAVCSTFAP